MRNKNKITVLLIGVFFLFFSVWSFMGKTPEYSESERRVLAKLPEVSVENLWSGTFSKEFENYSVERFPLRDGWRTVKAYVRTGIFAQKDNHDIYIAEGHISKLEYPMNKDMIYYATDLFEKIRETYLKDNEIYVAVIPDKNRYLAEKNGYLSMDYELFTTAVRSNMKYATYIEIADLLDSKDYYQTDSHWKQEAIVDVAERIGNAMGASVETDYKKVTLETPFYGVYKGQSARIHSADHITYLTNEVLEKAKVEGAKSVYDMEKANGRDPYEMFLSGNQPIVTIKNEQNDTGKRLIVFRDSFGSSIAPLLVAGYEEIVLVDLRYISSDLLGNYVDFADADVLFLYSTMLLNNSLSMK